MRLQNPVDIQDGQLRLVEASSSHVSDRYAGWLNDPVVVRFTEVAPGGHTLEDVRRYIEASANDPSVLLFAMEMEGYGHVGNLRLSSISRKHRRAVMALLLGERNLWGRGIGSAAIRLATDYALRDLDLHKVSAGIYDGNMASRRAFERAGYHCEATLRQHAIFEGRFTDIWQMARLRDE